ncbi:tRNA (adenosine(37)-N6)-threonylcarbamoyltransferase complex transferase subunit TsaD [Candidatus Termititenax persephonae]|uniref:tRNA N6-adenosine threonylcarbamoyltransferase n=1 Tax=Candidatus Termititenax persephonae TaxID=2218525 RepID=A0A388TFM6_9BACT|nr:tRNA (adenosine(37)-N6)-threonylcarbamoyltransferase complex transferase subunit TsaD [Candidatus Termititenax persephonae]
MDYILGIETSCDETAAAVVDTRGVVHSNVIATQIDTHKAYGGVIPEIASRMHVEAINAVIEQALQEAAKNMGDISALAVTQGPGLLGALLIGLQAAKTLAYIHQKPLIAVNHLEGHIFANFISMAPQEKMDIPYPFLCLLVSGGHTQLIISAKPGQYQTVGQTIDDAAGEAYDKVARILKLGYPGGPLVDRLAQDGASGTISFSKARLRAPESKFDFSFSGLKTNVLNYCRRNPAARPADVCAAFQKTVAETLTEHTLSAAQKYSSEHIYLAGGVAANQGLRRTLGAAGQAQGRQIHFPPPALCTDNAAMIAGAALAKWQSKNFAPLNISALPNWELPSQQAKLP